MSIAESDVEVAALEWFEQLGYTRLQGTEVSPGDTHTGRNNYSEVLLGNRLHDAIRNLNPQLSTEAVEEVYRKVTCLDHPGLIERNRHFHELLVEGVPVVNRRIDGSLRNELARIIDFEHLDKNDWLVVNQLTIIEHDERRPDVVVFVNGLPLIVLELKNPADENATIGGTFKQLQTYKEKIPSLFVYNEILVVSDGVEARAGTLTSNWERFQPWRTVDGENIAPKGAPELATLIQGICAQNRLLDLLRFFIVFESDGVKTEKKMAAYHQYHAVNKAVATTVRASALDGDQRAGVIWHTQGSGKSLTMVFYAGKIIQHAALHNPTLVLLTDRNDLDDQLFGTFSRCQALLRQEPIQAQSRDDIETLLKNKGSGGIVFTTIQKFLPQEGTKYETLSERRNIVLIANEVHRSQYGLDMYIIKYKETNGGRIAYGFAKYLRDALPNASYIGFTGTPIELIDKNTRAIFGDYIDQEKAVEIMQEKYEIIRALYYGFDYNNFFSDRASARLAVIPAAMEHILEQEDGKKRYLQAVTELTKAYALAIPHERALKIRDEVGFFQAVRASFIKRTPTEGKTQEDLDAAVRQIVSQAIAADGAIDLYATLGIEDPYVDLFSDEFLDKMRNLPHKHLAFEMLNKLINDQIKSRFRRNIVKAQSFEAKLEKAIKLYQERAIDAALTMLRANAQEIRNTLIEDERLGLNAEALAFYDALKASDSDIQELEDQKLRLIAEELVTVVKDNVSPDWTLRQSTRAHLSRTIRRFLRRSGYPLEKQQTNVVELLVKQAEVLSLDWNAA